MAYKAKSNKEALPAPPIGALSDEWRNGERHALFQITDGTHPVARKILRSVSDVLSSEHIYSGYHYHEGMEIIRILEGEAEMVVNNRPLHVEKGDLILINAFEPHGTYLHGEEACFSRTCIMFHPYRIFPADGGNDRFFGNLKSMCFETHIPNHHPANPTLTQIIDRIISLFTEKPSAWTVSAYAELIHFYAIMVQKGLYREPMTEHSYLYEFMRQVSSYIKDHLDEDISTSDIAAYCQYSTEHFCRIFKKCFDKTFKDYLNIYRIQRAKEFMESGNYETLSQISSKCGFNNQNHFSHMFKKYVGVLPSEYTRKRAEERKDIETTE